jgi:predicted ATPase
VAELLAACAGLKLLATSRAALRVYGEHERAGGPLALPDGTQSPEELMRVEAVQLFLERAQAARSGFSLTAQNARAVAEICRRLDGLPLAIELAAARSRFLPPEELLARLGDRLTLLSGGARSLPTRQQTLRGTIDWSYGLLGAGEQRLFRRLGIFAGGFTAAAAEAVCAAAGELGLDALDGLAALADHSLVRQEETAEGEPRFGLLETIRAYAAERLESSGEVSATRAAHARYYLALFRRAVRGLSGGREVGWLRRLREEQGNLTAAQHWAAEQGDADADLRLTLGAVLGGGRKPRPGTPTAADGAGHGW